MCLVPMEINNSNKMDIQTNIPDTACVFFSNNNLLIYIYITRQTHIHTHKNREREFSSFMTLVVFDNLQSGWESSGEFSGREQPDDYVHT